MQQKYTFFSNRITTFALTCLRQAQAKHVFFENCKICAEISPITQREKLKSPRWRFSSTAVAFAFHRGGVSLSPRWQIPFTAVTGIKVTTHFAKRNVRSRQKLLGNFSITKQGANSAWAPFPFLSIRSYHRASTKPPFCHAEKAILPPPYLGIYFFFFP